MAIEAVKMEDRAWDKASVEVLLKAADDGEPREPESLPTDRSS